MKNEMSMYDLLEKFQFSVMYEKMQNEKKHYSGHLEHGFADYLKKLYGEIDRGNFRGYGKERITRLLDDSWMYDYTYVAELFKHAKCNKVYVGNGTGLFREVGKDEEVSFADLVVQDGEQIAVIDKTGDTRYKFSMIEADKLIRVDMVLKPKEISCPSIAIGKFDELRWASDEESLVLRVEMKQKTPDGVFFASFDGQDYFGRGDVAFYSNEFVRDIEPSVLDRLQSEWLFGDGLKYQDFFANNFGAYPSRGFFRVHTDGKAAYRIVEPAQLASKMYREGLPYVLSISNYNDVSRNEYLEVREDERELYALSDADKKFIRAVQNMAPPIAKENNLDANNVEAVAEEQDVAEEVVQNSDGFVDNEMSVEEKRGILVDADTPEIITKLMQIREYGIELSPEQEKIIRTYEKLHSKEFREFQANREERERRQQEVREEIVRRNEEKEAWWSNPENPSNVREKEFSHMKKQISALEGVQSIDASLLSDSQNEMISTGKEFFELKEMFDSEEHVADTGMSNEAREWYQEHYRSK